MPTMVVTVQGALLRCSGGQVIVEKDHTILNRMPQAQVERVLLLGGVGFTTGFVNFALERRVPVTFLSQDGHYRARLDPGERRDVALRLAQYQRLENLEWRLAASRQIVRAKIGAQRRLLMQSQRRCDKPTLAVAVDRTTRAMDGIAATRTLPELMGLEGSAALAYFRALPDALRHPMPFKGRSRRPPKDPMNALLSLGYGLLTAEIIGALAGLGLDPQIGIFHTARGRMPALAEDVVELFRAPVADALALSLVNLRVLKEEDFSTEEDGGVRLKKGPLGVYFRQYRRRMQAPFNDRTGNRTSFRREVQAQAAHLRRVYLGEEEYQPFIAPAGGKNR